MGLTEQEEDRDPEFDEIVRDAKRQVEFNRKIGSIVLAVVILLVALYVHFFWDKPDKNSITVRLTIDVSELKVDDTMTLEDEMPSKGFFVNNNTFVIRENGTAEDLLNKYSEKRDVEVQVAGGEIRSIAGIEKYEYGNYYWAVSVNGEETKADPSELVLENTDLVVIKYTTP